MALADERGLAGVSMRAVAERVGVTPMALYPHVGNKATLLDGLLGRLLAAMSAELDAATARAEADGADASDWEQRMLLTGRAVRALARRHPWGVMLMLSRPAVSPEGVRFVDSLYQGLLAAGVPAEQVPRVERMISTFVLGFLASEAEGRFSPGNLDPRGRRGQLPEGALPGHAEVAPWLELEADLDAEFEADLRDLTRAIAALAGGR